MIVIKKAGVLRGRRTPAVAVYGEKILFMAKALDL